MNAFVTHPSVRIKGTENNYEPTQCMDSGCKASNNPHMHCPFCQKNESFHDPVILKAHYRVKHVDKGIEFAGLKVLRCCDHCDIVGTIKGNKEIKGPHWHCYKCKNGFNRRDEAVKHYRTHFRNPQTTFQIQISQDVTDASKLNSSHQISENIYQEGYTVHPSLTEAVVTATTGEQITLTNHSEATSTVNGKSSDGELHVSVAANETVGTSEGQTIMIIQSGEHLEGSEVQHIQTATIEEHGGSTLHIATAENNAGQNSIPNKDRNAQLEERIQELLARNQQLESEKNEIKQKLQMDIEQLRIQVQVQSDEISELQKREHELIQQISVPVNEKLSQQLVKLKNEHEAMLHQHLLQLQRTYISQYAKTNSEIELTLVNEEENGGHGDAPIEQQELIIIPSTISSTDHHTSLGESVAIISHDQEASRHSQHDSIQAAHILTHSHVAVQGDEENNVILKIEENRSETEMDEEEMEQSPSRKRFKSSRS